MRATREGPEGLTASLVWQAPSIPPEYQAEHPPAPWMTVPTADAEIGPMEWDAEEEVSETESIGVPTLVVQVVANDGAASPRRRRRRNRPYNPRRHFEMDDYEAAHLLTFPRSPSPLPGPLRRPLLLRFECKNSTVGSERSAEKRSGERRAGLATILRRIHPENEKLPPSTPL